RVGSVAVARVLANAGAAPGRGPDRTGDSRADGPDRGVGARQPASRHEAAPRETARMTDHEYDYLWDRSGEPDTDVVRLEALLARYRHRAPMPALRPRPVPVTPR